MIEQAYRVAEAMGIAVWCEDEAGPFQTMPYPGSSWQQQGHPQRHSHAYIRNGTAKLLTLFHPQDGQVRVKGVERATNVILHPWLKAELSAILQTLPPASSSFCADEIQQLWQHWRAGLKVTFTLPHPLPPLRLLLVWDNLIGHQTPELMVWLCEHGILPLFTPLSGSWLNMAESIQRILKRRALDGQQPKTPQQIIERFETAAQVWNQQPTSFEWGGKRAERRQRSRARQLKHALAGSAACTRTLIEKMAD